MHNEELTNNFVPFRTIVISVKDAFQYHVWGNIFIQLFGNILLFVPLSFSLYFHLDKKKKLAWIMVCVLYSTLSIEILQGLLNYLVGFNYRSVDIDDIILNTVGGFLGYFVALSISGVVSGAKLRK